jgi:hypothetical protein
MPLQVIESFPELRDYVDGWPVLDLIKMRLKYTSTRERRREEKMAAGRNMKEGERSSKVRVFCTVCSKFTHSPLH